jgi:hypothetical protein
MVDLVPQTYPALLLLLLIARLLLRWVPLSVGVRRLHVKAKLAPLAERHVAELALERFLSVVHEYVLV